MTTSAPSRGAAPAAILVVDDNAHKRLSIRSVLEQLGHDTVEADSGEAALHAVIKESFAVILMDVQMPGMDGYETARLIRMRKESEHTPIIFITAHDADTANVRTAYTRGAVDFIFAPIVPEILRAKVQVFVDLFLKSRQLEGSLGTVMALSSEAASERERLRSILSEIDAIIWESDLGRQRFTFVSQRAEAVLGFPTERWLEDDGFWHRIVHPDDLAAAELYVGQSIEPGETHEHEYRVTHADGRTLWIRDRVRAVVGAQGGLQLRGVSLDITARRELEARLLHSQKMDAIGQLAGGVAHDFNNMLAVISGYTDILLSRIDDGALRGHLAEISNAAERASALTSQLLAFGRRAPTVPEAIDLDALIHGVEPMLRRLIDDDTLLTIEGTMGPDRVEADSGQLEQVLVNLVINARDAMPTGGKIGIETRIADLDRAEAAERGLPAGRSIVLDVSDDGAGMTAETQAHIFEPFFTTKGPGKGTGLGLATVHGLVEQVGGKVTVRSEIGHGTTFSLYLPVIEPAAEIGGASPGGHSRARRRG